MSTKEATFSCNGSQWDPQKIHGTLKGINVVHIHRLLLHLAFWANISWRSWWAKHTPIIWNRIKYSMLGDGIILPINNYWTTICQTVGKKSPFLKAQAIAIKLENLGIQITAHSKNYTMVRTIVQTIVQVFGI